MDETTEPRTDFPEVGDITVRDMAKRELDVRVVPWGKVIETSNGTEEFSRGAFDHVDPKSVFLMGLEHEAHFGLGQTGQPKMTRHPVGKGIASSNEDDGQHMTFRVAKTQRGDEVLALADEGIVTGVSPEFRPSTTVTRTETRNGRRHSVHVRADLTGLSTTYRPAYGAEAAVLAVRSEEVPTVEPVVTPEVPAAPAIVPVQPDFAAMFADLKGDINARSAEQFGKIGDRILAIEERGRSLFTVPSPEAPKPSLDRGGWMDLALRVLSGQRVPDAEMRAAEDVITSDNIGVVPPAYLTDLIGIIDARRPFMDTTRHLPTPVSGMQLVVPVITQRPIVAEQTTEKSTLATQKTIIGTEGFNMVTKGGYGDISLQLLKRADRSFLDLYLQLLGEAYAIESEAEAIDALIHAIGEPVNPGPLNPANLNLGDAYTTSFDAIRRPPDTIWLSSKAVAEFIDAKATTTNQPLYPGLQPSATAGGGIRGTVSGLNAVHVPALDLHGAYAVVGPSNGFAWAEDGTYTLQVDVPAKAGRDVALVGMLWFAPWYPAAFTLYNVAS